MNWFLLAVAGVWGVVRWLYRWATAMPGCEPYAMNFDDVAWKIELVWGEVAPRPADVAVDLDDVVGIAPRPLLAPGDTITITETVTLS